MEKEREATKQKKKRRKTNRVIKKTRQTKDSYISWILNELILVRRNINGFKTKIPYVCPDIP